MDENGLSLVRTGLITQMYASSPNQCRTDREKCREALIRADTDLFKRIGYWQTCPIHIKFSFSVSVIIQLKCFLYQLYSFSHGGEKTALVKDQYINISRYTEYQERKSWISASLGKLIIQRNLSIWLTNPFFCPRHLTNASGKVSAYRRWTRRH